MIKCFYATGDSFAFGAELGGDDTSDTLFVFSDYRRAHCYSGIMADKLGILDYKNGACPGGSNERAYRVLLTDITEKLTVYKPEEIFVSISLTHAARREFCRTFDAEYYIHLTAYEPRNLDSPLWQLLSNRYNHESGHQTFDIMIVLAMQNFLRLNKIPYLITSSMGSYDEEDVKKQHVSNNVLSQLQTPRYLIDPSFATHSAMHNHKRGPQYHPLEEGHAGWADYLLNYISTHNLLSNADL